ncbi:MAG: PgaD family protein [Nitrospinota bacterium]
MINIKKNQHYIRKLLEGMITATLWGTCLFIAVILAKRVFAVFEFARRASELQNLFFSIFLYLSIPFGIVFAFLLWRYFNILSYKKITGDNSLTSSSNNAAGMFGLNKKSLFQLQTSKNQTIHFNKKTSQIQVEKGEKQKKGPANHSV